MRAAWYDHRGAASDVLTVGNLDRPEPGPGEVRIKIKFSGISPGDTKKRSGWQGAPMAYPRVIPHSDGAGTIDWAGEGVTTLAVGQKVWCYGAQSYRPFGTAAEYCVLPQDLVVALPDESSDDLLAQAASLGIAGVTGHRAVFADGPVGGLNVLVHGAAAGVGSIATQLAVRDGANVIALVRHPSQIEHVRSLGARHAYTYDQVNLATEIRNVAPDGIHRIAEVDLAAHVQLDADILAIGGVISSYYSSADPITIPYWPLGFADATLRLLGSDDFPADVKATAANALTEALTDGDLNITINHQLPLECIAQAHDLVDTKAGRVVLAM